MIGMDARTGKRLEGEDHLAQSVGDILSTPTGSLIGRRWYGSDIPEWLDQPMNDRTRLGVIAAGAMALLRQEPRLRATRIALIGDGAGGAILRITGTRLDGPRAGTAITFDTPVRARSALAA